MYDYGSRMYMPDIARWNGIDQLAEKFNSFSPYAYVTNNPVMFFDPDGRDMEMPDWLKGMWYGSPNGYNTSWNNTGGGFTSNWGGNTNFDGNPTNFSFGGINGSSGNGNFSFGSGGGYIDIPGITLTGNKSNWGSQIQSHFNSYMSEWNFQQSAGETAGKMHWESNDRGGVMMMDSMWDVLGIALANTKTENRYTAVALGAAAILFSKGRVADNATKVFRAVDDIELASINSTGKFLLKNGGTEAKYFANTLENAHLFGKQLYPNGYTVVEGLIYNSNNPMKYWSPGTDQIGAFIFHQKILQAVKPIFP